MANALLDSLFRQALQLHQAGRLRDANRLYEDVLARDPSHLDANNLSGLIALGQGDYDKACFRISAAIAANPNIADLHFNLGVALDGLGQLENAISSYGDALTVDPDHARALNNRATALRTAGRLTEATAGFRRVVELMPDHAEGHSNLGVSLHETGKLDEAETCHRKAIELKPDYAEAYYNLANVLADRERLDEAIMNQNRALALKPDFAEAHAALGHSLERAGRPAEAAASYCAAVTYDPGADRHWETLATCLEFVAFTSVSHSLTEILIRLLDRQTVDPQRIAGAVTSAVRHHAAITRLLSLLSSDSTPGDQIDVTESVRTLSTIPLLLKLLNSSILADAELEKVLTWLRSRMLAEAAAGRTIEGGVSLAAALALQCFANEYIYVETGEEKASVEGLQQRIAGRVEDGTWVEPFHLCVLACYRPLSRFSWSMPLLEQSWPDDVATVIARQVAEPAEERKIRSTIRCLTPISDGVSRSVRDQYEENPYPRWIGKIPPFRARDVGDVLASLPLVRLPDGYSAPTSPDVLIAGCGTGRHALTAASRYRDARVLAVDLSTSSLAHAIRKTRESGIASIDYAQADIMELGVLNRTFDLIESVGVLHHLADPVAGWRVLTGLLRPGGMMKIGLYSDLARRVVPAGRAMIDELGYDSTADGIRHFRHDMLRRRDEEICAEIVRARSFYSMSECRDFLFHVQEHRFDLPRLDAILDDLDLRFIGFEITDPAVVNSFVQRFPTDDAVVSLAAWHRFEQENPATFRGMYQFWCQKR